MVPVGIAIASFLSRNLSLDLYGQYVLAMTVVMWLETGIASLFGRAAWHIVADAEDWTGPASTIVWLHGIVGVALGALLFAGAPAIAGALDAPALATGLRILAAGTPISALATAHRQIAVGLGRYRVRAAATAGRSLVRLALVLILVALGFSFDGALLAHLGASIAELAICRARVRPGWRRDRSHQPAGVLAYAGPLFVSAIAMRLIERLDLVLVQVLRGQAGEAALYGAAQQLASLPLVASAAVVPVLSSSLARLVRDGHAAETRERLRSAMGIALLLLPLSSIAAGSGASIARLIFGAPYGPAGALLLPLLISAVGVAVLGIASAGLIVAGKSRTTVTITGIMLGLAIPAHVLAIARWGMSGAAWVTCAVCGLGAIMAARASDRSWNAGVPLHHLVSNLGLSVLGFAASRLIETEGLALLAELAGLTLAAGTALVLLGTVSRNDLATLRAALGRGDARGPRVD
jgi:PST family polysaccharide transporter